ncbi:MAG TPA: CocE/NonD family hydrolase [Acetobacteraceae bacterium]|nr:CocE/NonD family hydrolase [Acetobacteraceae bacterium]
MRRRAVLIGLAGVLADGRAGWAAPAAGPDGPERGPLREQVWWIPFHRAEGGPPLMLVTTVYRPPGVGPFPLALINHGAPREDSARRGMERMRFSAAAAWFVGRGYAVAVPARRGYARSEGEFAEARGPCAAPRYAEAGEASADDIAAALGFFRARPFVSADRVVLVGQSAGGWGVLALAARSPPGVRCALNFAGGRGSPAPNIVCGPDRLAEAAAALGARTRLPSLWIYTENDTYQPPAVSRRVSEAYTGAGGPARYLLLPPFGTEGHDLFRAREGVAIWAPHVGPFLRAAGLP